MFADRRRKFARVEIDVQNYLNSQHHIQGADENRKATRWLLEQIAASLNLETLCFVGEHVPNTRKIQT
jgi:hypothetical protein